MIKFNLTFDEKDNIEKLIYDPSLYDYLKENDTDFKQELVDFLVKTKFHQRLGMDEQEIKELIDNLPFDRKIIFNYKFPTIEVE